MGELEEATSTVEPGLEEPAPQEPGLEEPAPTAVKEKVQVNFLMPVEFKADLEAMAYFAAVYGLIEKPQLSKLLELMRDITYQYLRSLAQKRQQQQRGG